MTKQTLDTGDLLRLLRDGGLTAAYQPQVDIATGEIVAYEALARLRYCGESIPPSAFVPLLERNGEAAALDGFMLARASEKNAKIAVNFSVSSLKNGVDAIFDIARRARRPAKSLEIELTESVFDEKTAVEAARELREGGFSVAIDDFGRGYSSLAALKSVPADTVKLDRLFIRETDGPSAAIVRFCASLCAELHLGLLCEGVEDERQRRLLLESGCRLAQGFLFGRPK